MTNLLDNRLKCIYDMVDKNIVDVGTDHGKLVAQLLLDKKISKAICTDISQSSLQKAKTLIKEQNLQDSCEFFVGDGLTVLKQDYSDYMAVIAGMGGMQIIKILSASRQDNITNFVLQPMKNVILLRQWLTNNGYKIDADVMTKQGNMFYNILKVSAGQQQLTNLELLFGITNLQQANKYFVEYITQEEQKFCAIVSNKSCNDDRVKDYYKAVSQVLSQIKGDK